MSFVFATLRSALSPSSASSSSSSASSAPDPSEVDRSCCVCLEEFTTAKVNNGGPDESEADRRPAVLSCGHAICLSCCEELMKQPLHAKCPNRCSNGAIWKMPQPNYALMDMIQYTKRVEEALANSQQLAENSLSSSSKCGECGRAATVYCTQCDVDYCEEHADAAHAMKVLQSHQRVSINEKGKVTVARCEKHEGEKLNRYCTRPSCQRVCCGVCALDDHDGHKLISIQKAAEGVREELVTRQKRADEMSRELSEAMTLLYNKEDVARVSLAQCMEQLDAAADTLIDKINETRRKEKESWRKEMEKLSATTASLHEKLSGAQSSLADVSGADAAASKQPDLALLMTNPSTAEWEAVMKQAALVHEELAADVIKVKPNDMRWYLNGDEWGKLTSAITNWMSLMDGSAILSGLRPSLRVTFTQWDMFPLSQQPTLVYRATRDGFSPNDFYRCSAGKSPFLLLIKISFFHATHHTLGT